MELQQPILVNVLRCALVMQAAGKVGVYRLTEHSLHPDADLLACVFD
jgi:hypothetical protein